MKNESTEKTKTKPEETLVEYNIGENKIKLTPSIVQKYILNNNSGQITMPEFKFFCEMAKTNKLNPFTHEIYIIKYKDNQATVVVSKQIILKRATTHPKFDGLLNGIFIKTPDGKLEKRTGGIILENETLVGSWCEVFRKDWSRSMYGSYTIKEIKQERNPSWQKMPVTMAIKTATARTCRDAFPEDLGGLYEKDEIEMPQDVEFNTGFSESDLNCSCESEAIKADNSTQEPKIITEETNKIDLADL
nr:MAG TPA: RecT protein [Caudoviricetes sp.]